MNDDEHPIYNIITEDSLEQGDIISHCPVIQPFNIPKPEYQEEKYNKDKIIPEFDIIVGNMIIISQTCDIIQDNIDDLVLCPISSMAEFTFIDPVFNKTAKECAKTMKYNMPNKLDDDNFYENMNKIIQKSKSIQNQFNKIKNGERPAYYIIDKCDEVDLRVSIVDFHRLYTIPKISLKRIIKDQGKRARLKPPYRESFSQAFAKYFMRVALPLNFLKNFC